MRPCCSQSFSPSVRHLSRLLCHRCSVWIIVFLVVFIFISSVGLGGQGVRSAFDRHNPATSSAQSAQTTSPLIEKELRLAGDYLVGRGVPKDPAQAAYWYRKAADQGDPDAENQLGYFYTWGIGVARDDAEAFRWFARAAGSGCPAAKLNLAVMYYQGVGTPRDLTLALQLLNELADKQYARAEAYLGIIYTTGADVSQNTAAGEKWLSRAAREKNPEAEYALGVLWSFAASREHHPAKALKLFRRAAHQGYVPAMHALGILLEQHPEMASPDEALVMLERAAEAGSWKSSVVLGTLARDGHDRPKSITEAFRWFTIAKKQGGAAAERLTRVDLERFRHSLSEDEQNRQAEIASQWLAQHPNIDLYFFGGSGNSIFPIDEVYAAPNDGSRPQSEF